MAQLIKFLKTASQLKTATLNSEKNHTIIRYSDHVMSQRLTEEEMGLRNVPSFLLSQF